ncbi:hypothetical protein BX265_6148 [Streptomyces sp. TLI_235]|nr:hypothetical protein [Streptomyces sp. TLI_235]PBC71538.1 hypothetical protein BX265_6148 [Streptomyces sp. TLI_235]
MDRVDPNPPSPYATAHPDYRHIIPGFFLATPMPGVLSPTACGALAVVPAQLTDTRAVEVLPDGLCPVCVLVVTGDDTNEAAPLPARPCSECGSETVHDDLCALCRAELHEEWRDSQAEQADAPAGQTGADRVREAVRQARGLEAEPQGPITFS